jgi:hypothetical protein
MAPIPDGDEFKISTDFEQVGRATDRLKILHGGWGVAWGGSKQKVKGLSMCLCRTSCKRAATYHVHAFDVAGGPAETTRKEQPF